MMAMPRRQLSHHVWDLLILILISVPSIVGKSGGGGALLVQSSIERDVWKAWSKHSWNKEYNVKSPVLILPGERVSKHGDKTGWKLVMPTTALEEWEFYTTLADHHSASISKSNPATTNGPDIKNKRARRKRLNRAIPGLQNFIDDYNFKGFGISIYKSFLYFRSVGIAFRMPILSNWDSWDRNPALPSLNAMLCVYYPFSVSVCLSSSVRVEAIKWAFQQSILLANDYLRYAIYQFVRSLYILFSIFLFPIHGKWFEPSYTFQKTQKSSRPVYKSDIQERVGMSMSYGWSLARGWYTRTSYWHMYLPTLRLYQEALGLPFKLESTWLGKHFASLGTDISVPNPLPPHLFCTAVLSLSGFFFEKPKPSRQKEEKRTPLMVSSSSFSSKHSISGVSILNFLLDKGVESDTMRIGSAKIPIARGGDLVFLPDYDEYSKA